MINNEATVIGTITFEEVLEEEKVGLRKPFNTKNIGECIVEVYPNEGPVPHFHIRSKDGKFDCCVCITTNQFFSHGGHTDTLNSSQCKDLNKWLKNTDKYGNTNWENIKQLWVGFKSQSGQPVPISIQRELESTVQPNYTKIDSFRADIYSN